MSRIRVFLVDDHEIVRAGIKVLLMAEEDMEIIGEAASGQEAVDLARRLRPDVVVMDVQMPGLNGIEATRQITSDCHECAVLALTIHEDEQYFFQMLAAGALG